MNEAPFDLYIHELLREAKINADYQGSSIKDINEALNTASKNQTGNTGYPDFTALVKNFVLVIEDKADRNKLCLRDESGGISLTVQATKDYAVNGALFYAKKILEGTSYEKVFAFGCAGDPKHHTLKAIFVSSEKIIELDEFETFENFSPSNIERYYKKAVLKEDSPEDKELKSIEKIASTLHEDLRNYGNLGAHENPLVVAAILLALREQVKGFNLEQLTGDEIETDGEKLFKALQTSLARAKVSDQVKKEQVMAQFTFIKNTPILNRVNETLGKTPLKYFAEFINRNVYSKLDVEASSEDYIGRFYMEFIRYTGGDGQALGIVITPKHITELFCDLVDLKPDDVIFDPCCGTGGFLIAGMHRMLQAAKNKTQKDNIKKKNIHGIELRPDMFTMATTSMILHGDGQSNLICEDFFRQNPSDLQLKGITVGFMNPPYSQAQKRENNNLSELAFIEHLLGSVLEGGRVAVIVPISAMVGKTKEDKFRKADILKKHTLEGVISLNKNTFYGVGTVPCIAVFTAGEPHQPEKLTKFINFEDDGWEVKKHRGLVETERAKDRKQYLLDCWHGNIHNCPSKFMIETHVKASDDWLHSYYYFNDELPSEKKFADSIADYLTFEFNMISHGRGYLFNQKSTSQSEDFLSLESREWGNFLIEDLFSTKLGKKVDGNKVDKITGHFAYITRRESNNGLDGFIDYDKSYFNNDYPVITIGNETAEPFVQTFPFFTGTNVNILSPQIPMSKYTLMFIAQSLKMNKVKYSYAFAVNSKRLRRQIIQLPIDAQGRPDYVFMEKYMKQRGQKMIQDYLEYIEPRLKIKPKKVKFEGREWKEFFIEDVFIISSGKRLRKEDMKAGYKPFIGASDSNNGVTAFVSNGNASEDSNVLGVNYNGSIVENFYHPYECLFSDDVKRFKLKSREGNKYIYLFLKQAILAQKEKYTYGHKFNETRMKRQIILLPVDSSGKPDYKFMEDYMKSLEREILSDYVNLHKRS